MSVLMSVQPYWNLHCQQDNWLCRMYWHTVKAQIIALYKMSAQNCGYSLEVPQSGASIGNPEYMFSCSIKISVNTFW